MKKLLFIFALSLFFFLTPRANANNTGVEDRYCDSVSAGFDADNNTIVTLGGNDLWWIEDTEDPYHSSDYDLTLNVTNGGYSGTSRMQPDGALILNLGKIPPGSYYFTVTAAKKEPYKSAYTFCTQHYGSSNKGQPFTFKVGDNGQGGDTKSTQGTINFDPTNPKSGDKVKITVQNLDKGGYYYILSKGTTDEFKSSCLYSGTETSVSWETPPLTQAEYSITVSGNSDGQCQSSTGIKAMGKITLQTITTTEQCPVCPPNFQYNSRVGGCFQIGTYKTSAPTRNEDCTNKGACIPGKGCATESAHPSPPCAPDGWDDKGACTKLDTGLGGLTLSTEPGEFVKQIYGLILSLSGGVAILLIIVSGYQLMTSQGNPEKVQAAREVLTSAIIGLMFIIFSLALLQIIGAQILRIPGFG